MRRVGRFLGYLCAIAFAVLLIFLIVWIVQGTRGIDYGKVGLAIALLALAAERLTKL